MKNEIYFSVAEKEIIEWMVRQVGVTQIEAVEHVLAQKRELAYIHQRRGNIELARQILTEINEWSSDAEKDFQEMKQIEKEITIIVP